MYPLRLLKWIGNKLLEDKLVLNGQNDAVCIPTFMPIIPDLFFFFFHGSFIAPFLLLSSHRPLTPQSSPPSKTSVNDEGLILILLRCVNLTWLKLRGCREITEAGMAAVGENCKALKKLSYTSCLFSIKGINAVVSRCQGLEELFVKRLRGAHDGEEVVGSGTTSVTSVCLKEIVNGQSFAPLMIGSKRLRSLKVIGCLGDWDDTFEKIGNLHAALVDVHLEKVQVSDVGLVGLSKCLNLDTLHIMTTAECSNVGLNLVAENCGMLRKLHVDGWRTNRIGDDDLISVAKHCINLQEIRRHPLSQGVSSFLRNTKNMSHLTHHDIHHEHHNLQHSRLHHNLNLLPPPIMTHSNHAQQW